MARTIGILGGTFDPVHIGHLILAVYAREQLSTDSLLVIPNAQSPLKTDAPVAPFDARLEMLTLALGDRAGLTVSDIEGRRGGISYMADTVEGLRSEYGDADFHLILGADALRDIHAWHRSEYLLKMANLAVVARQGDQPPATEPGVRVINMPRIDISATTIRERIARDLPIDYLTTHAVVTFIRRHNLYKDD